VFVCVCMLCFGDLWECVLVSVLSSVISLPVCESVRLRCQVIAFCGLEALWVWDLLANSSLSCPRSASLVFLLQRSSRLWFHRTAAPHDVWAVVVF